jgi:ribonuclease-3
MLNLDEFVCVQPGVDVTSTSVLGDTLEAVIGALFLDSGFAATKEWVLGWFIDLVEVVEDKNIGYDYISELRSQLTSLGRQAPTFQAIPTDAAGADICVAVIVAGIEIARAEGESRRKASHRAAKKAIHFLKKHKRSLASQCSDMSPAGRARCKAEFRRVVGKLQRREFKRRASPSKKRR